MNNKKEGIISFDDYIIKEIHYRLNPQFHSNDPVEIKMNIEHGHIIQDDQMRIQIQLILFENAEANNDPFEMKVVMEGIFSKANENTDLEAFVPNGLAILFPYIRAIVSTYTASANIPPLILPTININSIINDK